MEGKPPQTIGEVEEWARSDNARQIAVSAGAIAQGRPVTARYLFVAALLVGKKAREGSSPRWLFNWLIERSSKATIEELIEQYPLEAYARTDLSLSTHAGQVLLRASMIAQRTVGRASFDARHILAALTFADDSTTNVFQLARKALAVDLSDFPSELVRSISRRHEPEEKIEAWRALLDEQDQHIETLGLAAFAADRPAPIAPDDPASDLLGIGPDTRAFARLICFEDAKPPLSICIFGDWGSGKSTFMEALEHEVDRLANTKHEKEPKAKGPGFVSNVVQIRFNAWHYADANLWASLTAVFFDQLRQGGHDQAQRNVYEDLIKQVAKQLGSLEARMESAEADVRQAERKLEMKEKALLSARRQLTIDDLTIASNAVSDQFNTYQEKHAEQLRKLGELIGRSKLGSDLDAFKAAVKDASSTIGKLALIGRVLMGGRWATYLALAAVSLAAFFGIGWYLIGPNGWAGWVHQFAGWSGVGAVCVAVASIWKAVQTAKPIIDSAWDYAKAVQEQRIKRLGQIAAKTEEAKQAASELKEAQGKFETAQEQLRAYGKGTEANAPDAMLRYFLFEDRTVQDYEKQIGLVSRARRSFEQLNAIVIRAREARKALKQGVEINLKVPDRIVLYIDDLDRCSYQQVYDVLQAIHLLLAFELFVVVVGVDMRWIEGAVARQFPSDPNRDPLHIDPRERAIDYLEKIFQIPFWLRPLTTRTGTIEDGGTYANYVRGLLQRGPLPGTSGSQEPSTTTLKGGEAPHVTPGGGSSPSDVFTKAPGPKSTRAEALESIRLEDEEIAFLASQELGAIAGKSPRAVKRLANIYCIIRAHYSGRELAAFLGRLESPAHYPLLAVLIAVEVGQSTKVADDLYAVLEDLPADGNLARHWETTQTSAATNASTEEKKAFSRLKSLRHASPRLGHALATAQRKAGAGGGKIADYLALARIVRRYSFNRYYSTTRAGAP